MIDAQPIAVLLVDDRAENLLALEALLAPIDGIVLDRAESGREALRLVLRREYAVVLLDVQMPGMDGFEVARLMRGTERTRNLPIVFVNAVATDELAELKGYDSGAVDYLLKPLNPTIVRSKVSVFVELARHRATITKQRADLSRYAVELERQSKDLARSNEELEQFAMVAAHDLKAPLRTIAGFLDMLREDLQQTMDDDAMMMMDMAIDSSRHLHKMIVSLLQLARIRNQPLEVTEINMHRLAEDLVTMLRGRVQECGAEVVVEQLPPLHASEVQVSQLLQNLLDNALKYAGEQPKITVFSRQQPGGTVYVVADNGQGIDPARKDAVFEPFRKLQAGDGAGLGLSLCHRIVQQHGGRIWVEETEGGGASICFQFPPHGRRRSGSYSVGAR